MKKILLALFVVVCSLQLNAKGKNVRVEPTFWWVDMHNPVVQLMLHGNNIASASVTIDYDGVEILETKKTDNPNYLFLYLSIEQGAKPGVFTISLKEKKKVHKIRYELKARKQNSANRESFTEKDNLYLIMPDRFANGNILNDSVDGYKQGVERGNLSERQGGDIEGIIQHLSYLQDLGITALWTTPLFENNSEAYSYHHYSASDYYKIDPRLGKNEDYLRLSEEANKCGIKTIIDVVPNHCGSDHWWLKDLPAKDWFNTWDTFTSSNYRMTTWTDPHASKSDLKRLTNGWFAETQPDLNLSNELLFDYMSQVYIFWIEYAQIAGMRVDTYPYNDIRVAAKFIQRIRDEYPKMNVVGECWVKVPAEIAYYQSGSENKDGFDSRLQSVMDFVLKDKLHEVFNEEETWSTGTIKFYEHFAQDFVYANTDLIMNFLDNHDIDRFSLAVGRDVQKYKMGLAMLIASRGYPQIYYGTEIMLDGIAADYQGHRFTFPGGWNDDGRNAFVESGRSSEENEVFNYIRTLLHYRKEHKVLQSGKMMQFIPEQGIYVFFRYDEGSTVMVICNNNESRMVLDTERFAERIEQRTQGVDIVTKTKYRLSESIEIGGKEVLLLELH